MKIAKLIYENVFLGVLFLMSCSYHASEKDLKIIEDSENINFNCLKEDTLNINDFYTDLMTNIELINGLSDSCVLRIFDGIKFNAFKDDNEFKSYELLFAISEVSDGWVSELGVSLITELFINDNKKIASFYETKQNPLASKFHQFLKEGLCIYIYDSNDPEQVKETLLSHIDNLSGNRFKSEFKTMIKEIDESICD